MSSDHFKLWALLAALGGLACGLSVFGVARLFKPGPPVVVHQAKALTERVQPGGVAVLSYDVERTRACPGTIYGFLVAEDGRALARFDTELGGYSRVGRAWVPVQRLVPADLAPGRVCYRHSRQDVCSEGVYISQGPDACFEVVE